jgi:hypothetical protein
MSGRTYDTEVMLQTAAMWLLERCVFHAATSASSPRLVEPAVPYR